MVYPCLKGKPDIVSCMFFKVFLVCSGSCGNWPLYNMCSFQLCQLTVYVVLNYIFKTTVCAN